MRKRTRAVLVSVIPLVATAVAGCSSTGTTGSSGSSTLCQTSAPAQEVGPTGWDALSFTFGGSQAVMTAKGGSSSGRLGGLATVEVFLGPKDKPPTITMAQDPPKVEGATITLKLANGQPTLVNLSPGDYWVAPVPLTSVTIQPCVGSSVSNVAVQPNVKSK